MQSLESSFSAATLTSATHYHNREVTNTPTYNTQIRCPSQNTNAMSSRNQPVTSHNQRSPGWSIYGLGHVPIQRSPSLPSSTDNTATTAAVALASSIPTEMTRRGHPTPPLLPSSVSTPSSRITPAQSIMNAASRVDKIIRSNSDRLATPSHHKLLTPTRSTSATSNTRAHAAEKFSSHSELTQLIKSVSRPPKPTTATTTATTTTTTATATIPLTQHSNSSNSRSGGKNKKAAQLDTLMGDLMLEIEALSSRVKSESDKESLSSFRSGKREDTSPVAAKASSPAQISHGECRTCREQIFERPIMINNGSYHRICLRCHYCGDMLDPFSPSGCITTQDGNHYCVNHVPEAPPTVTENQNCAGCRKGVGPDAVEAFGRHWHPSHLVCYTCGTGLSQTSDRYEHDGRVYCTSDYQKLSTTNCIACNRPHTPGDSLTALNARWHISCFNCQVCHKSLFPDKSFYMFWKTSHIANSTTIFYLQRFTVQNVSGAH